MDMGRESRWEKDAMTVEIMFALVSAAFVAVAVFFIVVLPTLVWDVSARVDKGFQAAAVVLGLGAAGWRVVHVLLSYGRRQRAGR
ncbi:DUF6332 family protein [Streptomyces rectiviolaceus]|uniref:Uncharacterized protein n=1 Tax=Streptomyces rectiviolaceus TaxID=332591 RepID=A0ABP6MZ39_9ACTN